MNVFVVILLSYMLIQIYSSALQKDISVKIQREDATHLAQSCAAYFMTLPQSELAHIHDTFTLRIPGYTFPCTITLLDARSDAFDLEIVAQSGLIRHIATSTQLR
jgi:hypothetical protein